MKLTDQDKARKEDLAHELQAARLALENAIASYNIAIGLVNEFAREKYQEMEDFWFHQGDDWHETPETGARFNRWMQAWDRASGSDEVCEPDFGDADEFAALGTEP